MISHFQISPRWNRISLERLHDRKGLPVLSAFDWRFQGVYGHCEYWTVFMQIQSEFERYIGVKGWSEISRNDEVKVLKK